MKQPLPDLQPAAIYRPVSPVVTGNEEWRRMRATKETVCFQIGGDTKYYSIVGPGRFMAGVGTYKELLKYPSVVAELNGLFKGTIAVSRMKAANDLFALIIGVEGCSRSAHNIVLARIFLQIMMPSKKHARNKTCFKLQKNT